MLYKSFQHATLAEMQEIVLIAHDIRSCHNVGSLLRTTEGLGIKKVYLTGYTPYPLNTNDTRLPHLSQKIHKQISKTALGAEESQDWEQHDSVEEVIAGLKSAGFTIIALEQASNSIPLPSFEAPDRVAILLGREVEGVDTQLLELCDQTVEIPMFGSKESFNVVQAAAMVLYQCRFKLHASKV